MQNMYDLVNIKHHYIFPLDIGPIYFPNYQMLFQKESRLNMHICSV